jgi:hypothetical protein
VCVYVCEIGGVYVHGAGFIGKIESAENSMCYRSVCVIGGVVVVGKKQNQIWLPGGHLRR